MGDPTAVARPDHVVVDDAGISLRAGHDAPVDVLFDGRRIGSFWSLRDTTEDDGGADGVRTWAWPDMLRRRLEGRTFLTLAIHGEVEPFYSAETTFGDGDDPLDLVDHRGNPLALDKSNRLTRVFEGRDEEHIAPLLDSMQVVLEALQAAGIRPFIAYGTLLGAVREGGLIGHDSDADLGYVSDHEHPADVVTESFDLQRRLVDAGFEVHRYSGAAFKVVVLEGDGSRRGLDVFAGFVRAGTLYLMGEVGAPFDRSWVHPLTEVELEGRTFPAPAAPERFLEAMYGTSWRVPDPAYKFETPRSTTRRLSGWFRGTRVNQEAVWGPYFADAASLVQSRPSAFAQWVEQRLDEGDTVLDVGCGAGKDVMWHAKQGRTAVGYDYVRRAYKRRISQARRREIPATFEHLNLTETRSVCATAAVVAGMPGPVVLTARHVMDAVNATGRANLLRLGRSLLASGGRLYLQVYVGGQDQAPHGVRPMSPAGLRAQVAAAGGTVVAEELRRDDSDAGSGVLADPDRGEARILRMVVEWR